MNREEDPKNTVIDAETGEILPGHPDFEGSRYEIVDYEGQEGRFYPASGAIMVFDVEKNRWIIRGNRGGRPGFDGAEMVKARELKKEQAILDGLANASLHFDGRTASDMLARIVTARAKNAVEDDGRTGNADAKFIFSLVAQDSEGNKEGPSLRVDMDANTAADFITAMREMFSKNDLSKEEDANVEPTN